MVDRVDIDNEAPPLVSVIIPAFNSAAFIRRALDSVVAQDYPNTEIIVVDDGSTDDTRAVVEGVGDPRIRAERQDNAGPFAARNRAIELSKGAFLAFLDSDDEWLPQWLSKGTAPMLADESIGMVWCHASERHDDGRVALRGGDWEAARLFDQYLWPSALHSTPATILRRDVFDRVGPFTTSEPQSFADYDLFIRVGEVSKQIEIQEPLVIIHARSESVSRSRDEGAVRQRYFEIIDEAFARAPERYETHRNVILAEAHHHWAMRYFVRDELSRARSCFRQSLRLAPRARTFAFLLKCCLPLPLLKGLRAIHLRVAGKEARR